jgi:transposase
LRLLIAYTCSVCGALVKMTGNMKEYTCEHRGAPIHAGIEAKLKGRGALKA